MTDDVNEPAHYNKQGIEVIDVIEAYELPYHLGNVVKYVLRHQYKGRPLQDLQKALWYLCRYVEDQEDLATIEERKDERTITMEELVEEHGYNPIEKMTTYEEAMTSPGLCPFIDIEGYVHGVQCGCMQPFTLRGDARMVPTITNWPPDSLPGATTPPETFVTTSPSSRVGGQVRIDAYDDYYGFNDDEVITKCGLQTCGKDIQAKDAYVTVGSKDFCGVPCLSTYRGVHGV